MRSKKDLNDLWDFMSSTRNLILMPVIAVLALIGILIIVAQSSAVAPFIYTLF